MAAPNRLDIYKRFKKICEQHTGTNEHDTANCFFVGDEYDLNTGNLSKGDQQGGLPGIPQYFYSEKWSRANKPISLIQKDFPAVMLSPGDLTIQEPERKRGSFAFDVIVYDLMFYDRNNTTGGKLAFREKEEIWRDTEIILQQVLQAFQNTGPGSFNEIYNLSLAADALGLPADPADWDAGQQAAARSWIEENICGEYKCRITGPVRPFQYHGNNRLAGVSVLIELFTNIDSCPGTFELNPC